MKYTISEVYTECLRQFFGPAGIESLGGTSIDNFVPGTLSEKTASYMKSALKGKADPSQLVEDELLPEAGILKRFSKDIEKDFTDYYSLDENIKQLEERAKIIFESEDPIERARAISELWSPELCINDDQIYNSWLLKNTAENPEPYRPEELIIQLNALYSPAGKTAPEGISEKTAQAYNSYMEKSPKRIAVYDHPVPVFTRGAEHELEKCLVELDADIAYEKKCGIFPAAQNMKILISISTTHAGLDTICEIWLKEILSELKIKHLDCYLLSEKKCRCLDELLGDAASIFTVQGKYACHFGALKYAQLLFERGYGIRAGFKLDTDEGIHSADMKEASGLTWLQQLCHPFWGGTAETADGRKITLGFNIGEYVDSRDLHKLGYEEAIRTPEVKLNDDLRGPYLLFNKGACQAKGTALLNRGKKLEDFISHPLVKGGGYGIDNNSLRRAVPVGFSMTGRAEDQQFYFSAVGSGIQGIFNPLLRIIHYKADVAKSEHENQAARSIADIYRMILFRELMTELDVVKYTIPFPANFASPISRAQVFWLWIYLIFQASANGHEDEAEEYLSEGLRQLPPLLDDIEAGRVNKRFNKERAAWKEFIRAVDSMPREKAVSWLEGMKIS